MKKIICIYFILISCFSLLFAQELINKCYSFPKDKFILLEDKMIENYLEKEIKLNSNILLEFKEDKEVGIISFISLLKPYPYNQGGVFSCYFNKDIYFCSQDDDGGRFTVKIKNDKLYLNIEYARLADNPDVPLMQTLKSKAESNIYVQGKEIHCKSFIK